MRQVLMSIAGSDSCAGAGIQADIKTFAAHGFYGVSVVTAVTAQNTKEVCHVLEIPPESIIHQMEAIFSDIPVHGVKIGMLPSTAAIHAVCGQLRRLRPTHVVLDPVMTATSGTPLLPAQAMGTLLEELFPLCRLVTPNIPEAQRITGRNIRSIRDMETTARLIHGRGARAVLVKAGHAPFGPTDVLFDGKKIHRFEGRHIPNANVHGTGCALSSAITAHLALGASLRQAVAEAKSYVIACMERAMAIGRGAAVLDHCLCAGGAHPGSEPGHRSLGE
jgi:hydroxymethylpyrimidine/phosphomethylpyrimidine kinase